MNRLAATAVVSAAVGAVVALALTPTRAQEAEARAQVGAVVDVTPITKELAQMRAELTALRTAVADAEGLRGDAAKATAAVQGLQEQVRTLAASLRNYTEATQPVIEALKPVRRWDYRVLRSRSESVAQRLGREGWELVTASEDWLYFKKPLTEEERKE